MKITFLCHGTVLCLHKNSRQTGSAFLITLGRCLFKIALRVPRMSSVPYCTSSCRTVIKSNKYAGKAWAGHVTASLLPSEERGKTKTRSRQPR